MTVDQKNFIELVEMAKTEIPYGCVLKVNSIDKCQNDLNADEKKLISSFSLGGKKEFTAGRVLGKEALIDLGKEPCSILSDKNGCPLWPKSIVGSISHKRNICGVLVGLKERVASVGIDIELQEPLSQPMWSTFATDEEVSQNITKFADEFFANIIFSAKEAFYKCIYPLSRENTPHLTKIIIKIIEIDDAFLLQTHFGGRLWKGKLLLNSSHILSLVWLPGKNV